MNEYYYEIEEEREPNDFLRLCLWLILTGSELIFLLCIAILLL